MYNESTHWVKEVKELFKSLKCEDIFENNVRIVNFSEFKEYAQDNLMSMYRLQWFEVIQSKPKLHMYVNFKREYGVEKYCEISMKRSQRSTIAKLRLGILPINVEIGRYSSTPREERYCPLCKNNYVEDEIHVLLYCPFYKDLRTSLLCDAQRVCCQFNEQNDLGKIAILASHINLVRKTANFIACLLKIREKHLKK